MGSLEQASSSSAGSERRVLEAGHRWGLLIVWLLIVAYISTFGVLSILRNDSFGTAAHDLGVMDQAAWNTFQGRFVMESSEQGRPLSRLRGHVEPVFLPISLVYLLYDNINALLLLQTVVVALGALPAYWLGRDAIVGEGRRLPRFAGIAVALAYLLYPPLEAATLTEFHPVTLVPALMLYAFHYARTGRWRLYALFGLLALSCKEDVSLTMAALGAYLVVVAIWRRLRGGHDQRKAATAGFWWGTATILVAVTWFFVSLYVVVPRFSASGDYQLFERYSELGGGPAGLIRMALTRPGDILALVAQPARSGYVLGLLGGTGFLSLLNPLTLVLALPSTAINLLSNYSVMYSGVSHYSAPVVPWIIVSAALGLGTLRAFGRRFGPRLGRAAALAGILWLIASSVISHSVLGFSPLGGRYLLPEVTDHHRLAQRFLDQIPGDARLSAQPVLYPHASHREYIYEFPIVSDAEYVWLDVTTTVGMHPNDFRQAVDRLITRDGFGIVDAADGYILLRRGVTGATALPDGFYDFARAGRRTPEHPVRIGFGEDLELVGFDLYEITEDGRPWTGVRTYWQATAPLPRDLRLYPFFFDDAGKTVEDTSQRPVVTALWYPPSMWRPGETVVMDKLPWPVGDWFSLGIGVSSSADWSQVGSRLAVLQSPAAGVHPEDGQAPAGDGGTWAQVAVCSRSQVGLEVAVPARRFREPIVQHSVGAELGAEVRLLGYDLATEGRQVTVTLYWQALAAVEQSYTVFLHLIDAAGQGAGQVDGLPAAAVRPTSSWATGEVIADRRTVTLREDAPDGEYRLVVGMYRLETMQRLPVADAAGRPAGDSVELGTIKLGR